MSTELRAELAGLGIVDADVDPYPVDWEFDARGVATRLRGQSRAAALLRRTPGGWRFIHYMEAPIYGSEDPP